MGIWLSLFLVGCAAETEEAVNGLDDEASEEPSVGSQSCQTGYTTVSVDCRGGKKKRCTRYTDCLINRDGSVRTSYRYGNCGACR